MAYFVLFYVSGKGLIISYNLMRIAKNPNDASVKQCVLSFWICIARSCIWLQPSEMYPNAISKAFRIVPFI